MYTYITEIKKIKNLYFSNQRNFFFTGPVKLIWIRLELTIRSVIEDFITLFYFIVEVAAYRRTNTVQSPGILR